jgi:hypothetical protein
MRRSCSLSRPTGTKNSIFRHLDGAIEWRAAGEAVRVEFRPAHAVRAAGLRD